MTVTDDGVGLDDPQVLLMAARIGWGNELVEPKGLGALMALSLHFGRTSELVGNADVDFAQDTTLVDLKTVSKGAVRVDVRSTQEGQGRST